MKKLIIPAVVLIAVLIATALFSTISRDIQRQSRAEIREAVLRAAVECYSVEGSYPGSLSYLEENYGLQINHRDFVVAYEAFADNLMPEVQVMVRGEG